MLRISTGLTSRPKCPVCKAIYEWSIDLFLNSALIVIVDSKAIPKRIPGASKRPDISGLVLCGGMSVKSSHQLINYRLITSADAARSATG
jgi:hypothetical protein